MILFMVEGVKWAKVYTDILTGLSALLRIGV